MAVTFDARELADAVDRHDVLRAPPAEVELDHEVGPAGEDCHIGNAGKVLQYIVQTPPDVDAHGRIITSAHASRSLAWPRVGRV